MMEVQVALDERSYPIILQPGLIQDPKAIAQSIHHQEVVLVTNETVGQLYASAFEQAFADRHFLNITVPDGEQFKSLSTWQDVLDRVLKERYSRQVAFIALGGGVVGDLTGFVAASYQRGVDYIQVPTTLLAQVDSSVGGKTAVNHSLGKNLIGAFHQPVRVLIDPETLSTLPEREFVAGLAEVIKYGLISDESFYHWLLKQREALTNRETEVLMYAIARCCTLKAEVVAQDETEAGLRAILNFGHTFAHAIEAVTNYQRFLHGEAVSIGMVLAAHLSQQLGYISEHEVNELTEWLQQVGLPVDLPKDLACQSLLDAMQGDKKRTASGLRFIVLSEVGRAVIKSNIDHKVLAKICT